MEPLSLKVYLLFLLVVCIFTTLRLVGVWAIVAPFRRRPPAGNPAYGGVLRAVAASLQHWSSLTHIVSGIFACTTVYRICDRVLADERTNIILGINFLIRQSSAALTMGLQVALYAFLARWHLDKRIENLD
jgi:hypothetical protein